MRAVIRHCSDNAKGGRPSTVEGIVCARLRLSLAGAMDLRNMLDKILKKSMPAKRETH